MTDEEKQAINNMKLFARVHQDITVVTANEMDIVLNLIEKQQKEIEELKELNLMQRKQLNDAFNRGWIHKDKIIAKVIEVKDRPVKDEFITATQGKLDTIIEIEKLLEKE